MVANLRLHIRNLAMLEPEPGGLRVRLKNRVEFGTAAEDVSVRLADRAVQKLGVRVLELLRGGHERTSRLRAANRAGAVCHHVEHARRASRLAEPADDRHVRHRVGNGLRDERRDKVINLLPECRGRRLNGSTNGVPSDFFSPANGPGPLR